MTARFLAGHPIIDAAVRTALRSIAAAAVSAVMLGGIATAPADAAVREERTFGSWSVLCVEQDNQPKRCVMRQQRVQADNKRVALVWAIRAESNDELTQSITLPAGLSIKEGVRIFLGDAEPMILEYDICGPRVCIASAPLDAQFIAAIQEGGKASVNFVRGSKQLVQIQLDLRGFAEAYDHLLQQLS